MNRINNTHLPLDKSFDAIIKAVAKLLGVKRLESGDHFVDDSGSAAPLIGERQYNMGDLWREPLGDLLLAESEHSELSISGARHEASSLREQDVLSGDVTR